MKYKDIKDLTVEELRKREIQNRQELLEIKLKNKLGQVANPLEIRTRRRDIAKMKTALAQKLK